MAAIPSSQNAHCLAVSSESVAWNEHADQEGHREAGTPDLNTCS